jgi:hypothetical protein
LNKKLVLIGIISIASALGIGLFATSQIPQNLDKKSEDVKGLVALDIKSLFIVKSPPGSYTEKDGKKFWNNVIFELNKENEKLYEDLRPQQSQKVVVIYPIFTAAAYEQDGFYDYYKGDCGSSCLTKKLKDSYSPRFETSGNAVQVLGLLGYKFITDVDVSTNPDILKNYDKIILLHNEYVTKTEFDAITRHPNIVYLYPNALYAEVSYDPENDKITLVRGHNYPEKSIRNGFDWKFDNSDNEYNTDCSKMRFDRIENGWMLNCYPETPIHASKVLLQTIKDLG